MHKERGYCSCGGVAYCLLRDPMFTHACHCKLCQRYTASAFVVHSMIELENIELDHANISATFGPSGSGQGQIVNRCKACGDQIYSIYGANKKLAMLKTSTLQHPERFPPQAHIYVKDKVSWITLDKDAPSFDEFYKIESVYPTESLFRLKSTF